MAYFEYERGRREIEVQVGVTASLSVDKEEV
jgi:hypothetical protein